MATEQQILTALSEKPLKAYSLLMRVDPSGSADALQATLLKMRAAGTVKFNINTGMWTKSPS